MESGIHHEQRTVRTKGHVLRPNQLPGDLPNDDECHLRFGVVGRVADHLHG